jgi:hypothetical protein
MALEEQPTISEFNTLNIREPVSTTVGPPDRIQNIRYLLR